MPPCSEGCAMGVRALFRPRSRRTECREPPHASRELQDSEGSGQPQIEGDVLPLEKQVREALRPHLATLQEAALHELDSAVERLRKAQMSALGVEEPPDIGFQRAVSAEPTDSPRARTNGKVQWEELRPIRRPDKRRWTTSMGGIGGTLTPACLVPPLEDGDTPATSTVVSAAASEVASDNSDSPPMSRRTSLRDGKDMKHRKAMRITFEFAGLEQLKAMDEPDEEEDLHKGAGGSDTSSVGKKSDASSMNWRADALDVGENLAAEAVAKKGMSVDSIVALVQEERERWEEERQALELQAEELKEQLRSMQAVHSPDAEKKALKSEHQELRKVMKARSRFGAWVCERHMAESDDQETDAEKEELRRRTAAVFVTLRAARAAVGAASSESDVSPIRRPPGPGIRRG